MKRSISRSLCHSFNSVNVRYVVKVSSDNWTNLAHLTQKIKQLKKKFIVTNFFILIKFPKFQNFFYIPRSNL